MKRWWLSWVFCVFVLAIVSGVSATNVSIQYGWNGTDYIPIKLNSEGAVLTDIDMLNLTAGNLYAVGNVTAIYFKGDGSLLTGVGGGNSSWNQSLADTIYVPYTNSNQNIVLGDYNFSVGTSDFFVNSNGNVGIGTTSPSVKFQVKGNTANEAEALAYFTDSEGVIMASIEKDLIGHGFLDVMATGGGQGAS